MSWQLFALIAALSDGFKSVIHRYVMKTESPYSYALIENILTAVAFLPLLLVEFTAPTALYPWLLVAASSILWASIAVIGFTAYKHTHISVKEPISQSKVVFVLILSALLLKEALTVEKTLGTLFIFAGVVLITYEKGKLFAKLSEKGVQLTLLSALLFAFVAIIDKQAVDYFTPGMFAFLVYLIPGLILLAFVKKQNRETTQIVKTKLPFVVAVVILGVVFYYFSLKAYALADASQVFPLIRLSSFVTVLAGMATFREERKNMATRIAAAIIIIAGAVLISGNYLL